MLRSWQINLWCESGLTRRWQRKRDTLGLAGHRLRFSGPRCLADLPAARICPLRISIQLRANRGALASAWCCAGELAASRLRFRPHPRRACSKESHSAHSNHTVHTSRYTESLKTVTCRCADCSSLTAHSRLGFCSRPLCLRTQPSAGATGTCLCTMWQPSVA